MLDIYYTDNGDGRSTPTVASINGPDDVIGDLSKINREAGILYYKDLAKKGEEVKRVFKSVGPDLHEKAKILAQQLGLDFITEDITRFQEGKSIDLMESITGFNSCLLIDMCYSFVDMPEFVEYIKKQGKDPDDSSVKYLTFLEILVKTGAAVEKFINMVKEKLEGEIYGTEPKE